MRRLARRAVVTAADSFSSLHASPRGPLGVMATSSYAMIWLAAAAAAAAVAAASPAAPVVCMNSEESSGACRDSHDPLGHIWPWPAQITAGTAGSAPVGVSSQSINLSPWPRAGGSVVVKHQWDAGGGVQQQSGLHDRRSCVRRRGAGDGGVEPGQPHRRRDAKRRPPERGRHVGPGRRRRSPGAAPVADAWWLRH